MMILRKWLLKNKRAKLFNGTVVKEGDKIAFINSDGERCEGLIQHRQFETIHEDTGEKLKKGSLFFWNIGFHISDYKNAFIV